MRLSEDCSRRLIVSGICLPCNYLWITDRPGRAQIGEDAPHWYSRRTVDRIITNRLKDKPEGDWARMSIASACTCVVVDGGWIRVNGYSLYVSRISVCDLIMPNWMHVSACNGRPWSSTSQNGCRVSTR